MVVLTQTQADIWHMLSKEFLTPKEIANRRKTSLKAIYKIINILKKKGFISGNSYKGFKTQCTLPNAPLLSPKRYIRLHGQEFNIRFLYPAQSYHKLRKRCNIYHLYGNTIRLYKHSIEVYASQHTQFVANTEQIAHSKSMDYWLKLFKKLEERLKIVFLKPDSSNIREVKSHYADVNNEIAKDYSQKRHNLKIKAEDDKLWLIIDKSLNMEELETIHPETSRQDMTKVQKHLNDMRLHNPPTLSQLSHFVMQNAKNHAQYAENLKAHVDSIKELGRGVTELTKIIKELRR